MFMRWSFVMTEGTDTLQPNISTELNWIAKWLTCDNHTGYLITDIHGSII